MLSIISMCRKFHFTDNIKIIKFILLCILQIKHCIIEITIFCYFQFSTIYIYYTEGVRRINRVIFVYIALIITLVRFFTPIHPSFSNLIYWIFVLYFIPIILCVIGFKAEKLIATMVIIPNFLGILYRLYAYVTHILFM
ncbi:TPA: hypothetical protein O8123_002527 [Staphylococcus aureus]|nr:hypothetical protein [Staphylococcus aureus]